MVKRKKGVERFELREQKRREKEERKLISFSRVFRNVETG